MENRRPDGFSMAYRIRGLTRGDFTAWRLPSGAELLRAVNPPYPFARARHEMAIAAHLCLARGPGRITRHVGETRELPPPRVGLLTLSPGATDLEYEAEGGTEMLTLSLSASTFSAIGGRADDAFARGLLPFRDDGLRAVLLELMERAACGASERLYVDHAIAFVAAALAAPRRDKAGRRPLGAPALKRVLDAIETMLEETPGQPPPLEALAGIARLSVAEFARGFRTATGESPHAFLTRRRIERAQELLRRRSGLPLADLAVMLGFADQAHFSRRFRQVTGTTPSRFRRSS
jgi:AraC family transcriptional regulator